ncbi:MAG: hypothetical protein P8N76_03610 [Pirellulaceae bacterium]|nr:hypothetical protein [Pirellulaceae bacterium]
MKQAAQEATQSIENAAQSAATTLGNKFHQASEAARSSLEGVDGGGEIMTKLSESFTSAHQALHHVTDGDTAQAAADKFDEMGDKLSQLPAEARTAIAAMIEKEAAELKRLTDEMDPTIKNVVKPKLDALINKLKSLESTR